MYFAGFVHYMGMQFLSEGDSQRNIGFFCTSDIFFLVRSPIQIVAFDSVLLVNDYYGDTLVHCLSLRTGGEITKFGVRGSGRMK